jgi:hypothetical protein
LLKTRPQRHKDAFNGCLMKIFLRCPLVSVAALATYLVVHVFAGVLHHHGAEDPGMSPTADNSALQFQTTSPHENDEEESCLLCSVLHLAQISPTALHLEAATALSDEALPAIAIIRPHPLPTATKSRGPPLM